ncbi:GAF domain-containing protein [Streptomyces longisporoflavus]|uniref:GAF domain-containing protein n=1 Tax=Streptomyces longisporoflavus TaxID=28044 RepID=A0ABW7QZC6_9ACTN
MSSSPDAARREPRREPGPDARPEQAYAATAALRELLDLLAGDAPAEQFARPAATARAAGASGAELTAIDEATQTALRVRRTLNQHQRREAELTALFDTAGDLAALRDLDAVLRAIVHRAKLLLRTDVAYLSLNDPAGGDTYMRVTDGSVSAAFQNLRLGMGEGLGGLVAQTARPYATGDYEVDPRFQHTTTIDSAVLEEGLHAILGVPLRQGTHVIGVLYAADRTARTFTPDEVALLSSLADHAAIAIDSARRMEETRAALVDLNAASQTIRAHSEALRRAEDAHDRLTDLVLRGGDFTEVATAIGALLRGGTLIHDADGTELARVDAEGAGQGRLDAGEAGQGPLGADGAGQDRVDAFGANGAGLGHVDTGGAGLAHVDTGGMGPAHVGADGAGLAHVDTGGMGPAHVGADGAGLGHLDTDGTGLTRVDAGPGAHTSDAEPGAQTSAADSGTHASDADPGTHASDADPGTRMSAANPRTHTPEPSPRTHTSTTAPRTHPAEPSPHARSTEPSPGTRSSKAAPSTRSAAPNPRTYPSEPSPRTYPSEPSPRTYPSEPTPRTHPSTTVPHPHPSEPIPHPHPSTTTPRTHPSTTGPRTHPSEPTPRTPPPAKAIAASRASGRAVPLDGTWVCAVLAGAELLGSIALTGRADLGEADRRLFERAAVVTALLLLLRRSAAEAEDRVRGELLGDLLSLSGTPGRLTARARRLDVDLAFPHSVFVAHSEAASRRLLLSCAARAARSRRGLSGLHHDHVVLVMPADDTGARARALATELTQAAGAPVTVGAAGPATGPEALSQAHAEALRCLSALRALGHTGRGADLPDLGFLGVLLGEDTNLDSYVRRTLGPVLDYDTKRGTELIHTLRAYFACGMSQSKAKDSLHVHVNTVVQRLDRIGHLLGPDWQSPERSLEIQLALRLHAYTWATGTP